MAAIAHGAAGIDATELKREALSFFGGRRMTATIDTLLGQALEFGVATGRLHVDADGTIHRDAAFFDLSQTLRLTFQIRKHARIRPLATPVVRS
ncbi:MAG: hypothetical protein R2843_10210 [Thermomicrobiales bacterium]